MPIELGSSRTTADPVDDGTQHPPFVPPAFAVVASTLKLTLRSQKAFTSFGGVGAGPGDKGLVIRLRGCT